MPRKKGPKRTSAETRSTLGKQVVLDFLKEILIGESLKIQFYDVKSDRDRERSDLQRDFKAYMFTEGMFIQIVDEEYITLGTFISLEESLDNEDYTHIPIGSIYYMGRVKVDKEIGAPIQRKWQDGR